VRYFLWQKVLGYRTDDHGNIVGVVMAHAVLFTDDSIELCYTLHDFDWERGTGMGGELLREMPDYNIQAKHK
jgi:hypothetical protein